MSFLFEFGNSLETRTVRMKWPSEDYVIPAGTPMSETGIANDGTAIGILAATERVPFSYPDSVAKLVGKKEPKGNYETTFEIIVSGFIDRERAEKSFGAKYSDAAISAMNIKFVDSENPKGFGGGASSWNDLTDRPFYTEETVVLPEATYEYDAENDDWGIPFVQINDAEYKVVYNGTEYTTRPFFFEEGTAQAAALGNTDAFQKIGDNGIPFILVFVSDIEESYAMLMPMVEATSVTMSIAEIKHHPIPAPYVVNAFPYYIKVTGIGTTGDPFVCNDTVSNVMAVYSTGRDVKMRIDGVINGYANSLFFFLRGIADTTAGKALLFVSAGIGEAPNEYLNLIAQADDTFVVSKSL